MRYFTRYCQHVSINFNYYLSHLNSLVKNNPRVAVKYLKTRMLTLLFGCKRLLSIYICPSHVCNANCIHCYEKFPHEKLRESLTTKQVKNIIDQFYSLNGCVVDFCSGEFLMRPDALDLVRYARSKNLAVSITTNGLLLTERKIDELKEAGLWRFVVSIDSANAQRHDECRGVKGCFEKAVNGIRLAKKKGIHAVIWTYVTKTNFDELEGIEKLAKQLDVVSFAFFAILSGHLFNSYDECLSYKEKEGFRKRFNKSPHIALEFPSERDVCAGGGHSHICVKPSGDVTYCPPVPYSYGNINSKSLKDCLSDIRKDYRRFSHCRGQCIVNFPEYRKNCNAKFIYGE